MQCRNPWPVDDGEGDGGKVACGVEGNENLS